MTENIRGELTASNHLVRKRPLKFESDRIDPVFRTCEITGVKNSSGPLSMENTLLVTQKNRLLSKNLRSANDDRLHSHYSMGRDAIATCSLRYVSPAVEIVEHDWRLMTSILPPRNCGHGKSPWYI